MPVLKSILQDDSPVAIRQACVSLKVENASIKKKIGFEKCMPIQKNTAASPGQFLLSKFEKETWNLAK